jgi:hypothetical protein
MRHLQGGWPDENTEELRSEPRKGERRKDQSYLVKGFESSDQVFMPESLYAFCEQFFPIRRARHDDG